jgi:hypothetical protein
MTLHFDAVQTRLAIYLKTITIRSFHFKLPLRVQIKLGKGCIKRLDFRCKYYPGVIFYKLITSIILGTLSI